MKKILLSFLGLGLAFSSLAQATMIADINPNGNSEIYGIVEFNNELFFTANDGENGYELWNYDGINAPTMIADINSDTLDGGTYSLIEFNNKLYFSAEDGTGGFGLWEYDGVNSPTFIYDFDITNGYEYGPSNLIVYNNTLYISAADGDTIGLNTSELWQYDGSNTPQKVLYEGEPIVSPSGMTLFQGNLFFRGSNNQFLKVDAAGSVTNVPFNNGIGQMSDRIQEFNGELYFRGTDTLQYSNLGSKGHELWKFDGVNFNFVADIDPSASPNFFNPSDSIPANSYPDPRFVFNNKLYIPVQVSDTSIFGGKIFGNMTYDGVNAPVVDDVLNLGVQTGWRVYEATEINNEIYYSFDNGINGKEIYKYDGINTPSLVVDINPSGAANPRNFIEFDGDLYFTATDGTNGTELWSLPIDPTGIKDLTSINLSIYPNPASSQITIDTDKTIETIVIIDNIGKTVKTITSNSNLINVSDLTQGIYFLKIQTDKGLVNKKFFKK